MERTRRKWDQGLGKVGRSALLFGVLILSAAKARAADMALLLGVDRDGKQDPIWINAVSEHLAHNGENLVPNQRLTLKDRACKGPECLDALAAREQANLVLSLSVQSNIPSTNIPSTYVISGTLYDVAHHLPYQPSRPDVCDCTADQLVNHLGQIADELFKDYRKRLATNASARVSTPPPGTALVTPPPSGVTSPPTGHGKTSETEWFTRKRKIAVGVLGGLTGAALITSIALTAINGNHAGGLCTYDGLPDRPAEPRCVFNTEPYYITGYVASAGLAIGLGFALFWPPTSNGTIQH